MAVAFDAKSTAATDTAAVSPVTHGNMTVGSGSNRVLLALIAQGTDQNQPSGLTVKWDSAGTPQTMTQIASTAIGLAGIGGWQALYGLVAPTSGNKTLQVAWTGGTNLEWHICCVAFTGADQTGGATTFPNGTTNTATSTQATITITSATGNYTVSIGSESAGNWSANTQTLIFADNVGPGIGVQTQRAVGAATVAHKGDIGGGSFAWIMSGSDILASGASTLNIGWRRSLDEERPSSIFRFPDEARPWFVRSPNPVPTLRRLPTTGEDGVERLPPIQRFPDEPPGPWFVRSPNPVPTLWRLPTTGEDVERLPPILRFPDEPPGPFFVRSPNPVPTLRRLPTTGEDIERLPPIQRFPDEPFPFFVRSSSPVPTLWAPTAGEHDHPFPIKRAPDEPPGPFFVRSPNPVPTRWLPTTGDYIERLPPVARSPDEALPFFVRSPRPVPSVLWFTPFDQPQIATKYQVEAIAIVPKAAAAASVGISGMAWFNPSVERLPPISRSPDESTPFFVRSPSPVPQLWLPNTGAEDRLPPISRSPDEATPFFRSRASIPNIWLPTPQDQPRPNVNFDVNIPGFVRPPPTAPVGIAGMAWWNPSIERLPPVGRSPDEATPFFVRSSSPVPALWIPIAGEHDHPFPVQRSPDEPPGPFFLLRLSSAATGPSVGSSISGGYFSRGKWRKLVGEQIAAHDAEIRAQLAKSERERAALQEASSEARAAIEAAEVSEAEIDRELAGMRRALEAAAGATRVTAAIKHAKAATEYARAVRQRIEDEEEEEQVIMFLLMH